MTEDALEHDGMLVTRARLGDRRAFDELVERHLPALHDHVARLTGDPSTDLTVRVFENVVERLGALREPARFRTWLYAMVGEELVASNAPGAATDARLTAPQRAVQRTLARLPLEQARALDLVVRRGFDQASLEAALGRRARRHYERAVRALQHVAERGTAVYASLPRYDPPPLAVVLGRASRVWSAEPLPAARSSHHGLVVWGAAAAAVLLIIAVPAAAGIGPTEREVAVAPVEYTAAPYTEAAGLDDAAPEEPGDEVLPPLPTFAPPTQPPDPEPSPSDLDPQPSPTADPSSDPSPAPDPKTPSPTPTGPDCALDIDLVCPSEEPSPPPSPSPEPDPSPSGEQTDEAGTQAGEESGTSEG